MATRSYWFLSSVRGWTRWRYWEGLVVEGETANLYSSLSHSLSVNFHAILSLSLSAPTFTGSSYYIPPSRFTLLSYIPFFFLSCDASSFIALNLYFSLSFFFFTSFPSRSALPVLSVLSPSCHCFLPFSFSFSMHSLRILSLEHSNEPAATRERGLSLSAAAGAAAAKFVASLRSSFQ